MPFSKWQPTIHTIPPPKNNFKWTLLDHHAMLLRKWHFFCVFNTRNDKLWVHIIMQRRRWCLTPWCPLLFFFFLGLSFWFIMPWPHVQNFPPLNSLRKFKISVFLAQFCHNYDLIEWVVEKIISATGGFKLNLNWTSELMCFLL